ncbi:hypothetical protein [Sphingomonas sanxanigenens]|uniref:Uncharacterized protein n=1 Tax=Sphingomonas sanxanigenens DSM 19645 = NX02 TaxID=1123269 RepID=W0A9K2_9SPHN|nr:hypothetical protein [Sphingomonas sanxanigenens]AHE54599.1 hypothetical protein NX02_14570 [Sphingomonas sanxanigenens DSM 19645 = NX02]
MTAAPLLVALLASLQAVADAPAPTLAARAARQPAAVRAFIDRRTGCNHWAGEEPYDAARRREIDGALADLRCARLDADEALLLRRYGGDAELRALLDAVRDAPGL